MKSTGNFNFISIARLYRFRIFMYYRIKGKINFFLKGEKSE